MYMLQFFFFGNIHEYCATEKHTNSLLYLTTSTRRIGIIFRAPAGIFPP